MADEQNIDNMDVEVTPTFSEQKKAQEGSPNAFTMPNGARLYPGKPEDDNI